MNTPARTPSDSGAASTPGVPCEARRVDGAAVAPAAPHQPIDINCDLGEDPARVENGHDELLASLVSSMNIACGGHAGDDRTMTRMVELGARLGRSIGAHPSYPDRANFGRVEVSMTRHDLERSVAEQVESLARICDRAGASLTHVKPHGALYHAASDGTWAAEAIARGVAGVSRGLVLVAQSHTAVVERWRAEGWRVYAEAFADRRYEPDGRLRSRSLPGALITDEEQAARQAWSIAFEQRVSTEGGMIGMVAQTLCVHGDTPHSVEIARAVRARIRA